MKVTIEVSRKRALMSGLGLLAALLLFVPFAVSASSAPQPLPEGFHCGNFLQQAAQLNANLSGALGSFSATVQAEKFNATYTMQNETYDSATGHFYLQGLELTVYNTTTNTNVVDAKASGILLDTQSNATYVQLTFSITSASWKADPAFMQKYYGAFPLTDSSLNDFTVTLGVNCSASTYTVQGSQQTNAYSLFGRYLRTGSFS